ncbi:MAG: 3-phosphoshikimate 1-carboxyvinyltransferase [Nitrososphaeraceae archaeon]
MVKISIQRSQLGGKARCPSSKSYTHRALFLALLSDGETRIRDPLISRDTLSTITACRALGPQILNEESSLRIIGTRLKAPDNVIDAGNSGTTIRIAASVCSLIESGYCVLTGDSSLRTRPMGPLLSTLERLGVECFSTKLDGTAPIVVKGGGLKGGNVTIDGSISSQFLSSLLIAAVRARNDVSIRVEGDLVSRPYILSTIAAMGKFGIEIERDNDLRNFNIKSGFYSPCIFHVPSDLSSASMMIAAGVLVGKEKIQLSGLNFDLPQGDSKIFSIVEQMNGKIILDAAKGELFAEESETLEGGDFDLKDSPDLLPVVSILALKAKGRVVIRGISHARFKETDRVKNITSELRKLGAIVSETYDSISIQPPAVIKNASLESFDDHRLFMALAIASLLTNHSTLNGAESVDVSYPSFLDDLTRMGANISVCSEKS